MRIDKIRAGDILIYHWRLGDVVWLALEDESESFSFTKCLVLPPVKSGRVIRIGNCSSNGLPTRVEIVTRRQT